MLLLRFTLIFITPILIAGASHVAHAADAENGLPFIVTCEPYLFPRDGPDPSFIPSKPTPLQFKDSDSEVFRDVAGRWQTILHMIANQEVALLRDQLSVRNVVTYPERAAYAYESLYSDSVLFSFLHHELPILDMARYAWNASRVMRAEYYVRLCERLPSKACGQISNSSSNGNSLAAWMEYGSFKARASSNGATYAGKAANPLVNGYEQALAEIEDVCAELPDPTRVGDVMREFSGLIDLPFAGPLQIYNPPAPSRVQRYIVLAARLGGGRNPAPPALVWKIIRTLELQFSDEEVL